MILDILAAEVMEPDLTTATGDGQVYAGGTAAATLQATGSQGSAPTQFRAAEKLIILGVDILLPSFLEWNLNQGWGVGLPWWTLSFRQGGSDYQIPNLSEIPFDGVKRENMPAYGILLDPRSVVASGFDIGLPYELRIAPNGSDFFPLSVKPTVNTMIDPLASATDIWNDWLLGPLGVQASVLAKVYVAHTNPMIP